ncbi:MAG: hypothetical protein ACK4SS_04970, partial [Cypionkella sp.]
ALIWQGVEDMAAIMAPGLAALRVLTARGQDAAAPALGAALLHHGGVDLTLAVCLALPVFAFILALLMLAPKPARQMESGL